MNADSARGELHEGDARYLLLRTDSLMGMFLRLAEPARSDAMCALAESVAEHGGRSAERYHRENPEGLLEGVASKASQLGWGVWRFSRGVSGELHLEVQNSPFAHGHGPSATPVCAAIAGMLRAVAERVFGTAVSAHEHACAAMGSDACRFRARVTRA